MMTNKKPAPKKRKIGRTSLYTEALAAKICRRLAEGETPRTICRDKVMPTISTVMGWPRPRHHTAPLRAGGRPRCQNVSTAPRRRVHADRTALD